MGLNPGPFLFTPATASQFLTQSNHKKKKKIWNGNFSVSRIQNVTMRKVKSITWNAFVMVTSLFLFFCGQWNSAELTGKSSASRPSTIQILVLFLFFLPLDVQAASIYIKTKVLIAPFWEGGVGIVVQIRPGNNCYGPRAWTGHATKI